MRACVSVGSIGMTTAASDTCLKRYVEAREHVECLTREANMKFMLTCFTIDPRTRTRAP